MSGSEATETGAGPVVVLVHGWGMTAHVFLPLMRELRGHYRLIAPDLAGHGARKEAPGPYTFQRYGEEIAALVEKLGLSSFHLLGWSMGGTIAARYCLEGWGPKPESLILLSAPARFMDGLGLGQSPASVRKMERLMAADHVLGLRGFIYQLFETGEAVVEREKDEIMAYMLTDHFPPSREALRDTLRELATTDVTALAGTYAGRVLLIHGSLDKICPDRGQTLWQACFGSLEQAKLEGAGHAPHLTRPREVARIVADFLGRAG
ncbi:MAG: alpha/beta hydrolase [Nitrospinae bacterium]|nr:alpha/beta hydrolase [Nitrospinota bacterium]